MKIDSLKVAASLALVTGMLLAGTPASAAGPHGSGAPGGRPTAGLAMPGPSVAQSIVQDSIVPGGFFTLPSAHPGVVKDRIVPGGFFAVPSAHNRFGPGRPHLRRFPRRFVGAGVIAPPVIVEAPPAEAYGPDDYYDASGSYSPDDPSAGYNPPVVYTQPVNSPVSAPPPPPAPPTPNVIQYETGRYELRGDGMTTPYTWVWIPNPPPPPPSAPPIAASPWGPGVSDAPSVRASQLYRWTDEQGVVHLTDRVDSVPRQYRAQAKQAPPS
jgi:uncharacterized protein DUF4124